jgi:hypothetical protein
MANRKNLEVLDPHKPTNIEFSQHPASPPGRWVFMTMCTYSKDSRHKTTPRSVGITKEESDAVTELFDRIWSNHKSKFPHLPNQRDEDSSR